MADLAETLKELELAGYIIRRQLRGKDGRISDTEYTIFERPRSLSTGCDFTRYGKPVSG